MNEYRLFKSCLLAALVGLGNCLDIDQAGAQTVTGSQSVTAEVAAGVEVLTRGPVHEAFAETVTFNPEPGVTAPKAPPEAIEEVPPDQRPAGNQVAWVPGYWAWDDERNDFLWVSGIWRALPPGRQWVPGYWSESGRGFQWTSGYWADAAVTEIEYLPAPPASVEVGPNIAAPSQNHSWQPGSWVWHQSRYAWRPGYWAAVQPDWVWTPAYYVWSPRGYVFNDGYWDYSVTRRGVLFAPVYFNRNVYAQRGFNYSPTTVINPIVLMSHLFLRPNYQHYYFGDYYATSYSNAGFYPWFSYNSSRYGYDPIFAQQRWQNRQDRGWEQNLQATFQNRRDHENARPPRTLAAQRTLMASGVTSRATADLVVASPFDQLAKNKESPLRFQPVDKEERQKLAKHGQDIQRFRQERQKLESKVVDTSSEKSAGKSQPTKVRLPPSPLVARSEDRLGKDQTPPKRHEVLKPDLQVAPKPAPKDEPKTGAKADRKSNPKDDPKTETKPDRKPTGKVDPKPSPKDEPKSGSKVDPSKPRDKVDPKPNPKDEPKPDTKPDRKPAGKVDPKPSPKDEPKPDTKPDRKPAGKVDPKPSPKDEPKPGSKVDPSKPPKVEVGAPKGERPGASRSESLPKKVVGSQPLDPKQPKVPFGEETPRAGRDPINPRTPPRDEKSPRKVQPPSQPKVAPTAQQPQNQPAAGSPAADPKSETSKDKNKGNESGK